MVERNVILSSRKVRKAEIDIVAYKDDEVHVFEVKCSYRFAKAKKQILRILRLLRLEKPVKGYFYCGGADKLECVAKAEYS